MSDSLKLFFPLFLLGISLVVGFIYLVSIFLNRKNKESCRRNGRYLLFSMVSAFLFFWIFLFQLVNNDFYLLKKIGKKGIGKVGEEYVEWQEEFYEELASDSEIEQLLKTYNQGKDVPNSFYTYHGWRDFYRYPLVHPYVIYCVDSPANGFLKVEVDPLNSDSSQSTGIYDINRFAFDKNYILIESKKEIDKLEYTLYQFQAGSAHNYDNLEQMKKAAVEKGYDGPDTLMTIREYRSLF